MEKAPGDPPSPCINVCHMDPRTGLCVGCWRTLDEIGGWPTYSPQQKQVVLARIAQRQATRAPGR